MARFSTVQRRFLWGCVIAYSVAYLNRLNLSAALGAIGATYALTDAQTGLLQTAFALVYAAGQLVNGLIADRLPPYRHLLLGVAGYAACNLLMGAAGSYPMLLALCVFNGAFQSMLWTPIVRMLAHFYHTTGEREKANLALSLTMVLGHLGAWAIAGSLSETLGWRYSFFIPGAVGVVTIGVCSVLLRDSRGIAGVKAQKVKGERSSGTMVVLAKTGFLYLVAACVLYGFVRDGIVTWAPQKLSEAGGAQGVLSSLLIPLINSLGIVGAYLFKRYGVRDTRRCVALMLGLTAVFCLPLPWVRNAFGMAVVMGMACACLYGVNPLITTQIPLEYDYANCVSLTAGLIDSSIYIGSALAGVLGGVLTQMLGTEALYISWAVCMVVAMAVAFVSAKKGRMERKEKA